MNFITYSDLAVEMAVDLVNTRDPLTEDDDLKTVADLRAFLAQYKRDWPGEDWHPGRPTRQDVLDAVELRERLRTVFAADDVGEAAALLNGILSDASAVPRISTHSAKPHLHFEPLNGGTASWLAAATAMGLGVALCDGGLERFGMCSSHSCVDVFIDGSKNRSRLHCSTKCATRDNVAALRERQRKVEQTPTA
jgi:predicted RNA-binding Zn ribbon-like protein